MSNQRGGSEFGKSVAEADARTWRAASRSGVLGETFGADSVLKNKTHDEDPSWRSAERRSSVTGEKGRTGVF